MEQDPNVDALMAELKAIVDNEAQDMKGDAQKEAEHIFTQIVKEFTKDSDINDKQSALAVVAMVEDRDKMIKDIEKVEGENLHNKMEIKMLENEKKQIKEQLTANKEHLKQMVQNAAQVEKQRDKFSKEASKANTSLMQMVEEVKLKKNMIGELKKEKIEFEAKLKQQQNLYEAVRSDRNLDSKNLLEA